MGTGSEAKQMRRTLALLAPVLVPSWRFFDAIGPSPRIEYALSPSAHAPEQAWRAFRPRPTSISPQDRLKRLISNPVWNESLFLVSCAERLIAEPTDHSRRELFYRVRRDVARRQETEGLYLSVRIAVVVRGESALERHILYTSPAQRLEGARNEF